jgi:hypothetical protein
MLVKAVLSLSECHDLFLVAVKASSDEIVDAAAG